MYRHNRSAIDGHSSHNGLPISSNLPAIAMLEGNSRLTQVAYLKYAICKGFFFPNGFYCKILYFHLNDN